MADDELDLAVRHEGALRPDGLRRVGGHPEHVAAAEELLRAGHIDDRAGIDGGCGSKRDASGDVRLDEAGDDVDRRPLRPDHEVDARRPGQLRDPGDLFLDLNRCLEHQIRELVDDQDDVRDPVAARLFLVVRGDVAGTGAREEPIAPVHLARRPVERVEDRAGVVDDGDHEVRDAVEPGEIHPLEVADENADLVRGGLHQQAREDRADADALPGSGLPRDEQVRQLGQIRDYGHAGYVLAERDGQLRR